ncbi:hypothetical protein SAMD00019534_094840 [Acytostelium subglobosum LB1]|uniref:hypothetical protein n=1 Tax=Acytostelium subglobosum LB1 TaxID=1410327 RepID=UPI000644C346|nr:hypothetical protein SAMD00019534_094840 [Acytostelium subglobosum LB1]GAM26309.1 hypothetical protein SAMD00019534_094840 [Acytostelium subglobosum LB1]|eukprot:XP_012750863.1 hypothetical protein SAMD00019534_094840 [Acytostelium subglobosum LB1]
MQFDYLNLTISPMVDATDITIDLNNRSFITLLSSNGLSPTKWSRVTINGAMTFINGGSNFINAPYGRNNITLNNVLVTGFYRYKPNQSMIRFDDGTIIFNGCTFTNITSGTNWPLIYGTKLRLTLNQTTFANNSLIPSICDTTGAVIIISSTFHNNHFTLPRFIDFTITTTIQFPIQVIIDNCTFTNNQGINSTAPGTLLNGYGPFILTNSVFDSNSNITAAIDVDYANNTKIEFTSFTNNQFGNNGLLISLEYSNVTMTNVTINANTATNTTNTGKQLFYINYSLLNMDNVVFGPTDTPVQTIINCTQSTTQVRNFIDTGGNRLMDCNLGNSRCTLSGYDQELCHSSGGGIVVSKKAGMIAGIVIGATVAVVVLIVVFIKVLRPKQEKMDVTSGKGANVEMGRHYRSEE